MERVKIFTILLILLVIFAGCITIDNPAPQRREIYFIDDNTEVMIGKNMAESIVRENEMVYDRKLLSYLTSIGKKIASLSDRSYLNYEFYIIRDESINAFALPGGYIFVHRGTLEDLDKDELAFVLAHEIGHICARHSIKKLQASLGVNLILAIALKDVQSDLVKKAIDVMYNVIFLGYSRQDEFLADSLAVKYTIKAGYDPRSGLSLMEKLK
ncbi:MAG: M48 family metalloprotease, partial [Candidatus Omnitrophica bacterium]|nr:M48 family metalloprotease [Candidatus Omnitrophota bacterium]